MKKEWGKVLAVAVASVMLAGMTTGCSEGKSQNDVKTEDAAAGDERIPIEIWTWDIATCTEIHQIFEEKFPQYKIVLTPVESSQLTQKLQTTLASGGQVPDICLLEYTHRGKLFQLDIWEDISAEPYNFPKDQMLDWLVPNETDDFGNYVGPEYVAVGALAYKRNLTKEYFGTDDPQELQTMFPDWDSFIKAGIDVQEKSGGKVFMMPSVGSAGAILKGQSPETYFNDKNINFNASIKPIVDRLIDMKKKGIVDMLDYGSPEEAASCGKDEHIFFECPAWALSQIIYKNDPDGAGRWGLMLPPGGGYCRLSRYMTKVKSTRGQVGNGGKCRFIKGLADFMRN